MHHARVEIWGKQERIVGFLVDLAKILSGDGSDLGWQWLDGIENVSGTRGRCLSAVAMFSCQDKRRCND